MISNTHCSSVFFFLQNLFHYKFGFVLASEKKTQSRLTSYQKIRITIFMVLFIMSSTRYPNYTQQDLSSNIVSSWRARKSVNWPNATGVSTYRAVESIELDAFFVSPLAKKRRGLVLRYATRPSLKRAGPTSCHLEACNRKHEM